MNMKSKHPTLSFSRRLLSQARLAAALVLPATALVLPAAALVLPASAQAQAQDYPNKPVRIVVGFPPGGIMDIYGRSLANQLQAKLKNPVLVDNRPGGGGLVGANEVLRSAPDGYTLTHIVPSTMSTVFIKNPGFDVLKAMQPIASIWAGPFVLSISSAVPANTVKEFIDYARANPGKVNFGGSNGPNIMPMMLLAAKAGVQMQRIDYKGAAQMYTAMLANEIQGTFNTFQSVIPFLDSGKIRVLGVTGKHRLPRIANVPTMAEAGIPIDLETVGAIMAPLGVPAPIAQKLNAAFREIVASAETEKLLREGGRPLIVSNEELQKLFREEFAAWEAAAKITGYEAQ